MSNAAQPSLLRRLMGMRAAQAAPALDPADMGTAIGLDFCLDEPPGEAATGALAPVRTGTAPAGWLRRLSAG
jgi:hypothetical protein